MIGMNRTSHLLWAIVFLLLSSSPLAAQTPKTLMVGTYDDAKKAEKVHDDLKKLADQKTIAIDAYAVVSKDKDGKVSINNTQQRDRRIGAVAGGILGLMVMGPAGAAVGGALSGAGLGGLTGAGLLGARSVFHATTLIPSRTLSSRTPPRLSPSSIKSGSEIWKKHSDRKTSSRTSEAN